MNIFAKLMNKLRRGTATLDEIENLDRRLFCLGAAATAGGLIARPTIVDLGAAAPVLVGLSTPELPRHILEWLHRPGVFYAPMYWALSSENFLEKVTGR